MKDRSFRIAIVVACIVAFGISNGCKDSPQQDDHPDLKIFKRDQMKEKERISFDDTEFIDSCVFIQLETSEKALIGEIKLLETFEGKFYIYDRQTEKLKVFGPSGEFLYDIGRMGQGSGEYISIHLFVINPKERKICVFDPMKMAVHEYSLEGKFLQSKEHHQAKYADMKKAVYAGDILYCLSSVNDEDNLNWTYTVLSSNDYSVQERFRHYPVQSPQWHSYSLMYHPFSFINGEFHYTSLFSDTIYRYENGLEIPYILIETGKPNIPPTYFKNRELVNEPNKAYYEVLNDTRYSEGFTELGETDRFLLTNTLLNRFFYFLDKKENKGYYVKTDYYTPDLSMPQLVDGNKLIRVWDQNAIERYQDEIKEGKRQCPDAISKLIEGYDPGFHNPILVVYYMKQ